MVEPVSLTVTATAIATLIFSKAFEEGGKKLGEAVFKKIGQLVNLVTGKFKAEGVEGMLTRAKADPNQKNRTKFESELLDQMENDREFADKLKALIEELKSDEQVKQIFFKDVEVTGQAEIGNVEQTATREGSVIQEAVTGVKVGGNLKIGNVKQQS